MNSGAPSEDFGPDDRVHRLERRTHARRRRPPTACAACEIANPPYIYLEDGEHYCVECALLVATTEQSYPAAWREEDVSLEELLLDGPGLPPRVPNDRRRQPASEYDLPEELAAS